MFCDASVAACGSPDGTTAVNSQVALVELREVFAPLGPMVVRLDVEVDQVSTLGVESCGLDFVDGELACTDAKGALARAGVGVEVVLS